MKRTEEQGREGEKERERQRAQVAGLAVLKELTCMRMFLSQLAGR